MPGPMVGLDDLDDLEAEVLEPGVTHDAAYDSDETESGDEDEGQGEEEEQNDDASPKTPSRRGRKKKEIETVQLKDIPQDTVCELKPGSLDSVQLDLAKNLSAKLLGLRVTIECQKKDLREIIQKEKDGSTSVNPEDLHRVFQNKVKSCFDKLRAEERLKHDMEEALLKAASKLVDKQLAKTDTLDQDGFNDLCTALGALFGPHSVYLNAPTGTGKTAVAYEAALGQGKRCVFVAPNTIIQQQVEELGRTHKGVFAFIYGTCEVYFDGVRVDTSHYDNSAATTVIRRHSTLKYILDGMPKNAALVVFAGSRLLGDEHEKHFPPSCNKLHTHCKWDVCIYDEFHQLRPSSKTMKVVKKFGKSMPILALSATPSKKNVGKVTVMNDKDLRQFVSATHPDSPFRYVSTEVLQMEYVVTATREEMGVRDIPVVHTTLYQDMNAKQKATYRVALKNFLQAYKAYKRYKTLGTKTKAEALVMYNEVTKWLTQLWIHSELPGLVGLRKQIKETVGPIEDRIKDQSTHLKATKTMLEGLREGGDDMETDDVEAQVMTLKHEIKGLKATVKASKKERETTKKELLLSTELTAVIAAKVQLAEKLHKEGVPLVIFDEYLDTLNLLEVHLQAVGVTTAKVDSQKTCRARDRELKRWKKGEATVLLASIQTAGTGLDLPEAGHVILPAMWNNGDYAQVLGRVKRRNSKKEEITCSLAAFPGTFSCVRYVPDTLEVDDDFDRYYLALKDFDTMVEAVNRLQPSEVDAHHHIEEIERKTVKKNIEEYQHNKQSWLEVEIEIETEAEAGAESKAETTEAGAGAESKAEATEADTRARRSKKQKATKPDNTSTETEVKQSKKQKTAKPDKVNKQQPTTRRVTRSKK